MIATKRKTEFSSLESKKDVQILTEQDIKAASITALHEICLDKTAPAAARASCARTLLEFVGAIGAKAAPKRDDDTLDAMSRADIETRLKRITQA